jgi:hypothetical protein
MSGPHTVYRAFAANGDLLYIGIASDPETRFICHEAFTPWWPDVADTTLEEFASDWEAEVAEKAAILAEVPFHNVSSNHRWHTKWRPAPPSQAARDAIDRLGEREASA